MNIKKLESHKQISSTNASVLAITSGCQTWSLKRELLKKHGEAKRARKDRCSTSRSKDKILCTEIKWKRAGRKDLEDGSDWKAEDFKAIKKGVQ